jgi:hypothetical protein
MADENRNNQQYHLYAQLSKTFFSYKKPSDTGYAMMYIQYHNGMLTLKFRRAITSENKLELSCYLPDGKAYDLAHLLEGIMARRRDAYANGVNYDADEVIKVPCSAFREGKDVNTGLLVIDTEMYDGIPRIRVSYTDFEKNDTVEIVFNSRVPNGAIEAKAKANNIDYADIAAFEFINILKEVQNPLVPIMYRIQDSAVNAITKYISSCFGNRGTNTSGGFRTNNPQQNVPDDFDPF